MGSEKWANDPDADINAAALEESYIDLQKKYDELKKDHDKLLEALKEAKSFIGRQECKCTWSGSTCERCRMLESINFVIKKAKGKQS